MGLIRKRIQKQAGQRPNLRWKLLCPSDFRNTGNYGYLYYICWLLRWQSDYVIFFLQQYRIERLWSQCFYYKKSLIHWWNSGAKRDCHNLSGLYHKARQTTVLMAMANGTSKQNTFLQFNNTEILQDKRKFAAVIIKSLCWKRIE